MEPTFKLADDDKRSARKNWRKHIVDKIEKDSNMEVFTNFHQPLNEQTVVSVSVRNQLQNNKWMSAEDMKVIHLAM